MQLVLGAQSRLDLGSAGDPVPLRPERWRLGERGRRWLRRAAWCSAFVVLVALGGVLLLQLSDPHRPPEVPILVELAEPPMAE